MELQQILQKLTGELTCFICFRSFLNPTTLACGHNFCHTCLVSYWGEFPIETKCPRCQEKIPQLSLIPNIQLTNITKLVKELINDIKQIAAEGRVCKQHPPTLKAFCRNELVLFCSMCDLSREHLNHDVVPVAQAAQEYKGQLLNVMGTLKEEKKRMSKHHTDEGTQTVTLIQQIEKQRQFVIAEFNAIRQFLEEQEKFLLLKVLENLEKGMLWKRAKHAAILFRDVPVLDELIQTVKEKCQQSAAELLQPLERQSQGILSYAGVKNNTFRVIPTPSKNLKDVGSTLNRCKQTLTNPLILPPRVIFGVWDFSDFNTFLGTLMKQFKDTLVSGYQIQKANVTLDPDTAHPNLILSEDLKSFCAGRKSQKLIMDDKRFDLLMCVLGREMFVTGRHYWDVAVENEGYWGVGVARRSVKRKGVEGFIRMEGVWAVVKCYGTTWMHVNPPAFKSWSIHQRIKKIRVSLNYPGGRVSFCDGERGNLLHSFSGISFAGEPICPFFWVQETTRLSLCP